MILTSNGLILTNNHVIEGSTSITARDIATGKTYTAKVVGYDLTKDVAVLQLENASGLTTVSSATRAASRRTRRSWASATPAESAERRATPRARSSRRNQSITANSDENPDGSESLSGLIETNARSSRATPAVRWSTTNGKVIGMDTAASGSSGGLGFSSQTTSAFQAYAIPINTALFIAKEIEHGDASTAVHIGPTAILGIEVQPTEEGGSFTGTPPTTTTGVTVGTVMANTPAASSGLVAGDVITSFDGHAVSTTAQLSALEYSLKPGQSVTITYVDSSGTQSTATFDLTTGPPQ